MGAFVEMEGSPKETREDAQHTGGGGGLSSSLTACSVGRACT